MPARRTSPIVDAWGNAVALTATVESAFGSQRMADGFLLNNQLTDFSFRANAERPAGGECRRAGQTRRALRCRRLIVTDRNGELVLVIGSPGGSSIIGYVARTTIGILDWGLTPQQAIDLSQRHRAHSRRS